MGYGKFIEYILQKNNIEYVKRISERGSTYFHCQNPISIRNGNMDKSKSASWYSKSGKLSVYNADTINHDSIIPIHTLVSYMGWNNEFKAITNMSVGDIKTLYSKNNIKVSKVEKSNTVEEKPTKNELSICSDYIKSRGLSFQDDLVDPTVLVTNKEWRRPAIAFRYPNGFNKYRVVTENKKFRYMSKGQYKELFCAYGNFNNKCIITEGEICALSISQYINDYDIYALHNLKAVCKSEVFGFYDEILVLLDKDKFDAVKESVYTNIKKLTKPNSLINIRPKVLVKFRGKYDNDLDFNDLHVNNMLDKETILTGYLSKKHIDGKAGFEDCEYYEKILDK